MLLGILYLSLLIRATLVLLQLVLLGSLRGIFASLDFTLILSGKCPNVLYHLLVLGAFFLLQFAFRGGEFLPLDVFGFRRRL